MGVAQVFNLAVALGGGLLGVIAFFMPDVNKWLAAMLAFSVVLVFSPIKASKEQDEFLGVLEIIRYACIAWAVLMVVQQAAKAEFIRSAPTLAAETVLDMRDAADSGRLLDVEISSVPREPPFTGPGSYVVQPAEAKNAIVAPLDVTVARSSERAAKDIETNLFFAGTIIAVAAVLLRLLGIIVGALAAMRPKPEG